MAKLHDAPTKKRSLAGEINPIAIPDHPNIVDLSSFFAQDSHEGSTVFLHTNLLELLEATRK